MKLLEEYINKIKDFLDKKEAISYAFIFGSILKEPLPQSDIDILIGGDIDSFERLDLSADLEMFLKKRVDLVVADQASCALLMEAFSKGRRIFVNNEKKLKKDYFQAYYRYEDWIYLRDISIDKLKKDAENG